jgi:osmotically-inducible protein OsmY
LARTTDAVQRVEDSLTVNAGLIATTAPPSVPNAGASTAPSKGDTASSTAQGPGTSSAQPGTTSAKSDDTLLTTRIQSKFFLDDQVRTGSIDVTSKNGVVTLEGTAPSPAAKQRAITLARETDGVSQVIDRINVTQTAARSTTAQRPARPSTNTRTTPKKR